MSIDNALRKNIPAMDLILHQPECKKWLKQYSAWLVKSMLRASLAEVRLHLGNTTAAGMSREQILAAVLQDAQARLEGLSRPSLRPVINATGIILHTGLGRAPLAAAALKNIETALQGYCNLEFDLTNGKRGERNSHVSELLCRISGAEDALAVNNNAAAVMLALNTFCAGREAIISRGQLVEIGGSFRIPEVMQKSGARMHEVGTTNKTRFDDYRRAISAKTGAIVVAHTSNYRVLGFTEEVELQKLADLAHEHNLPLIHDLGGGVLIDLRRFGLPYEPLVQDSLRAGADVVTFSGDKVLGGPQAGLIVGKKQHIARLHRNPLLRALRCDKLTFAVLEATLRLYLNETTALLANPTLAMLALKSSTIKKRAAELFSALDPAIVERYTIRVQTGKSQAGSGALPLEEMKSYALVLRPAAGRASTLAARLRAAVPPVIGYVQEEQVWLDLRTVFEEQIRDLAEILNQL